MAIALQLSTYGFNCCSNDYKDYAEVCFKEFGDRVKHWITFNEPWSFCTSGYASGKSAPGRCSPWEQGKCSAGDSGTEPYTVCHHQILAHAETVRLYKEKYQVSDEISPSRCRLAQFFNEINADSSFSNVYTSSSLTQHHITKCKTQAVQKGSVGITLVSNWFVPFSRSKSNNDAARRAIDFMLGW